MQGANLLIRHYVSGLNVASKLTDDHFARMLNELVQRIEIHQAADPALPGRAFQSPKGKGWQSPPEPKKKDTLTDVLDCRQRPFAGEEADSLCLRFVETSRLTGKP